MPTITIVPRPGGHFFSVRGPGWQTYHPDLNSALEDLCREIVNGRR